MSLIAVLREKFRQTDSDESKCDNAPRLQVVCDAHIVTRIKAILEQESREWWRFVVVG